MKKLIRILFNRILRKKIVNLFLENLILRQQLVIMKRSCARPVIYKKDKLLWVLISKIWINWQKCLIIVKPDTVVRWHKNLFRLFWRFKCRRKGRPSLHTDIRALILNMVNANPLWGAPRIHGELLMLGIRISERTVSRLMKSIKPKQSSQTWNTFLKNHMHNTISIDFFIVPTAMFKVLFVFIVLSHDRRRIIHFNVTKHPSAQWTAQQVIEACPYDDLPKYLLRDRDSIYGSEFKQRIKNMGINDVVTAFKSPWQNCYVERVIGSIRRECLNHMIVLNANHLKRVLSSYIDYYNQDRTHLGIGKKVPEKRPVQIKPSDGKLIGLPRVGGLHHKYEWRKAA